MSQLCDDYGLDVWIWYPAMDPDYADPKTVELAPQGVGRGVPASCPRIDAVFVPGGDPGHTQPKVLMALLEKQAAEPPPVPPRRPRCGSRRRASTEQWLDEFLALARRPSRPGWPASSIGPQVRVSLPELRRPIPSRYPIRDYPDITHSLQCQYPVPDWDVAFALTEGREVDQPAPAATSRRSSTHSPTSTIGFITYSEGCNDDVNKFVWSALGWDPERRRARGPAAVRPLLHRPRRRATPRLRPGALALEQNWRGPLLTNGSVDDDARSSSSDWSGAPRPRCWRTGGSSRPSTGPTTTPTCADRLIYETDLEEQAMDAAAHGRRDRVARGDGAGRGDPGPGRRRSRSPPTCRARVFELAEALFQSIRMQLSVPRYKAIAVGRGANLDTIDVPLERPALAGAAVRGDPQARHESRRGSREIEAIVELDRTPAPAGSTTTSAIRSDGRTWSPARPMPKDPASFRGPMTAFDQEPAVAAGPGAATPARSSASRCGCDTPGSIPAASYKVRWSTPATCSR